MTPLGIYRHYKGGLYRVLFVAHESTNAREGNGVVVYVSLKTGRINVRDEGEFHSTSPLGVPRFEFEEAVPTDELDPHHSMGVEISDEISKHRR